MTDSVKNPKLIVIPKLIEMYAHDYRDMKMSQEYLTVMLTYFAHAVLENFKETS
ncbi:MAG: hypothetical protein Q8P20_01090 [bacterium]|nr:hypothetical protein [bacterium]